MASSMSLSSLTVSTYKLEIAYSAFNSFWSAWGMERWALPVNDKAKNIGMASNIFFM
jgi:hypothetical protein